MKIRTSNREICIFISSTFQDMQEERNYLVKRIFPQLKIEAAKRDVAIVPLDLRWGISEDESKTGKVIQICLQEIERSRPFFIGLLGNRYGWCPSVDELEKNPILRERWGDWLENDLRSGLSVTEIEMQYGVLRSSIDINAYFFIKQPEVENVEEGAIKQSRLKLAIRNQKRYPVSDYFSVEELGLKVKDAFLGLLNKLYPETTSPHQQELYVQQSICHSLTSIYVANKQMYEILDNFIADKNSNLLSVTGSAGIGKSALLANWLEHARQKKLLPITVCYFVTNTTKTSEEFIIEWLVKEICVNIGVERPDEYLKPERQLKMILSNIAHPLLLVLDGLDKLSFADDSHRLLWLPEASDNVKIIVSASEGNSLFQILKLRNSQNLKLQVPNSDERLIILTSYLNKYSKKITLEQQFKIVNSPLLHIPFYLKSMLGQLIDYGVFEEIDQVVDRYVQIKTEDVFFDNILTDLETHFTKNVVEETLSFLVISRNGLSESEIFDILNCSQLEWSQLYAVLSQYTFVAGNLITLSTIPFRRAITNRYLHDSSIQRRCRQKIISYFSAQPFSNRKVDELAWQYYCSEDYECLYEMMINVDVFNYYYDKDMYEMGKYWRCLNNYNTSFSIHKLIENVLKKSLDSDSQIKNYGKISIFTHLVLCDNKTAMDSAIIALTISEKEVACNYSSLSSLMYLLSGLSSEMGNNAEAINFCKKALSLRKMEFGLDSQYTLQAICRLALLYNYSHQYKEAEETYTHSLIIFDKLNIVNSKQKANVLNEMGEMYAKTKQIDKAAKYMLEALQMRIELEGKKSTWVANSYNTIGRMYEENNLFSQAMEMFEKGLNLRLEIYGESHPDTLTCMSNVVRVLTSLKRYDEANEMNMRIIQLHKNLLSENHEHYFISLYNQAELLYQEGEYEKALSLLIQVKDGFSKQYDENHENIANCSLQLGRTCRELKRFDEALGHINLSISIYEKIAGHNSQCVATAVYARALVNENLGSYEKAINDILECLSILRLASDGDPILKGVALYELGRNYNLNQQYEKAFKFTTEALKYRKKLYGVENNKEIINCIIQLADVLDNLKQFSESVKYAEKALTLLANLGRETSADAAYCHMMIAYSSNSLGKHSDAVDHSLKCFKIRFARGTENPDGTARAAYEVAYSYYKLKNLEQAYKWAITTLELRDAMNDYNSKSYSLAHNLLGVTLFDMNKNEEAILHYKKVLDWRKNNLRPDDPDLSLILRNIAYAYMHMNKYEDAYDLLYRVVLIQIRNKDENNLMVKTLNNLAECIKQMKMNPESTSQIILMLISHGIRNKGTANLCDRIAFDYFYKERLDDSLKFFLLEVDILKNDLQEKTVDVAWALMNVGILLRENGQIENAIDKLWESYEIYKSLQGYNSESAMQVYNEIARLYKTQGKFQQAFDLLYQKLIKQIEMEESRNLINDTLYDLTSCIKEGHIAPEITYEIIQLLMSKGIRVKGTTQLCRRGAYDYYNMNCIDEALKLFILQSDILIYKLGETTEETAEALMNIGIILRQKGQIDKAIEKLKESYHIYKLLQGENGVDAKKIHSELLRIQNL